jgi:hypothetical protein
MAMATTAQPLYGKMLIPDPGHVFVGRRLFVSLCGWTPIRGSTFPRPGPSVNSSIGLLRLGPPEGLEQWVCDSGSPAKPRGIDQ